MVQGSTNDTGSSSREYGLMFEVGPPTAVRPGVAFTLPVIVHVRPVGTPSNDSIQGLLANASLRDEAGTSHPGLTGGLTTSVRSRVGNTTSGYARFSPLRITSPGTYRLRVILAANTYSGVTTKAFIESAPIQVHEGATASQRPTPTQVSRLQSLLTENIDISQADIAAWQQA